MIRTLLLAGVVAAGGLIGAAPAAADPFDQDGLNASQYCTANNDFGFPHSACVTARHKNDATFLATACKDPINQQFAGTDNQGQCIKFFKALIP
jgi:hypothetical protein